MCARRKETSRAGEGIFSRKTHLWIPSGTRDEARDVERRNPVAVRKTRYDDSGDSTRETEPGRVTRSISMTKDENRRRWE